MGGRTEKDLDLGRLSLLTLARPLGRSRFDLFLLPLDDCHDIPCGIHYGH